MSDVVLEPGGEGPALRARGVDADPLVQFERWYAEAVAAGVAEPDAMTLATAAPSGAPSARTVLYKGVVDGGLAFYTNLESRKGLELEANPRAALLFYWREQKRQVRAEGPVRRVADARADRYFASRPFESRLGAWASPQSEVIAGRDELEERFRELAEDHEGDETVPRPPFWGGFAVVPDALELWQGRAHRLHDRLRYRRDGEAWVVERLAP